MVQGLTKYLTQMTTLQDYKKHFYIENNELYWLVPCATWQSIGDIAGGVWKDARHSTGYRTVTLHGIRVKVHRVMYQMYHNIEDLDPNLVIDHIDRNGLNNSESNLRLVTQTENIWNSRMQHNNTTGHKGVNWHKKNKKWTARLAINGKRVLLGCYTEYEEAVAAYEDAVTVYRDIGADASIAHQLKGANHVAVA